MKKILIALAFLTANLCAQAQEQIVLDANAVLRDVDPGFSIIKLSGAIRLVLSQSEDVVLAVSAADGNVSDIQTVVTGKVLNISGASRSWKKQDKRLTVYLSFKDLDKIDASGASDVAFAGPASLRDLTIHLSGASKLKGSLNAQTLHVVLSGASEVHLQGVANNFNVECGGASDAKCYELLAMKCNADASGASDLTLNVQQELNATASGASHIFYKGEVNAPNLKISGVSKIEKRL